MVNGCGLSCPYHVGRENASLLVLRGWFSTSGSSEQPCDSRNCCSYSIVLLYYVIGLLLSD